MDRTLALAAVILAGCGRYKFEGRARDAALPDGGSADAPLTYRDVVLADSPAGYWRLADATQIAVDETGRTNGTYVGTCQHGVTGLIAGDPSTATHFDGASCEVDLGGGFNFAGSAAYTLEAWASFDSVGAVGQYQHLLNRQTRNTQMNPVDGYALLLGATGAYSERVVGTSNDLTTRTPINANQAYHFVATYDGTTLTCFIDGQAVGTVADSRALATFTANLLIGATVQGSYAAAVIDEVAVYDHALSPDRIDIHHRTGRGL